MKKLLLMSFVLFLALFAACGGAGAENRTASSNGTTVSRLMEDARNSAAPEPTATPLPRLADMDVSSSEAEVDLTLLSGTVVYSLVSQMMFEPEEFEGKTVKMSGIFNVFEGERRPYFSCIITDATACCANGIEFIWAGEHSYPQDYPAVGQEITVTGTFELYEEDDFQYCQLADALLTF